MCSPVNPTLRHHTLQPQCPKADRSPTRRRRLKWPERDAMGHGGTVTDDIAAGSGPPTLPRLPMDTSATPRSRRSGTGGIPTEISSGAVSPKVCSWLKSRGTSLGGSSMSAAARVRTPSGSPAAAGRWPRSRSRAWRWSGLPSTRETRVSPSAGCTPDWSRRRLGRRRKGSSGDNGPPVQDLLAEIGEHVWLRAAQGGCRCAGALWSDFPDGLGPGSV